MENIVRRLVGLQPTTGKIIYVQQNQKEQTYSDYLNERKKMIEEIEGEKSI